MSRGSKTMLPCSLEGRLRGEDEFPAIQGYDILLEKPHEFYNYTASNVEQCVEIVMIHFVPRKALPIPLCVIGATRDK